MDIPTGSCLCGEVTYKLNSEIVNVVNCHCNFCRSHSGAAFSTYAALPYSSFEITKGREKISSFAVEKGKKHFCSACGTPLFNLNEKYPGACMIYFGTLTKPQEIIPKVNIWCESKLGWVDSLSSVPSVGQGIERK
jgi:hypothetical protein